MADTLELSAEEQRLMDQMRADDAQQGSEASVAQEPVSQPPEAPAQPAAPTAPERPEPRQDMVPHQALHQEREEHKRTRQTLAETQQHIRTLEERTNLLLQRFGQQPQPPASEPQPQTEPPRPPIPDLDKDPVGHIIGNQLDFRRQLAEQQAAYQQQLSQYQQQQQAMQTLGQLTSRAQAVEQQFMLTHPDYTDAVRHLTNMRHQELERVGFRDPAERQQIIQQEGLSVAARMFQAGGNPAEAIYELAKLRGYGIPAPPQPATQPVEPVSPTVPAEPAQAVAQPQQTTGAQRLQTIAEGQQQARSLGGARGAGPVPLTATRLLEMSEAEFAKMIETPEGLAILGA